MPSRTESESVLKLSHLGTRPGGGSKLNLSMNGKNASMTDLISSPMFDQGTYQLMNMAFWLSVLDYERDPNLPVPSIQSRQIV
jgi:hypothetical protein